MAANETITDPVEAAAYQEAAERIAKFMQAIGPSKLDAHCRDLLVNMLMESWHAGAMAAYDKALKVMKR